MKNRPDPLLVASLRNSATAAFSGLALLLSMAVGADTSTSDRSTQQAQARNVAIAALQHAPHDVAAEAATAAAPPPPSGQTPGVTADASGQMGSIQLTAPPSNNPFGAALGTNGRSCNTCHQPQDAWSINATDAQARFQSSSGNDPLFRPVDGAVCPNANVSTMSAKQQAYTLLLSRGLIRIGMPMPKGTQFAVTVSSDQYGCNSNPATGLTSPTAGIVSIYRRPLPSSNLAFNSSLMWDGREPNLTQQASDAVLGHEQATTAPTSSQLSSMTSFESGVFNAQVTDNAAGSLTASGATGGPQALSQQRTGFYVGINDPFGHNPNGTAFNPNVFLMFSAWAASPSPVNTSGQSIARGENIFNTRPITMTGVGGLNDALGKPSIKGSCSTCHDTPNAGSHSYPLFLDIGVSANGTLPAGLVNAGLPVLMLQCQSGSLAGQSFYSTDPGRALVTGSCADISHFKVPGLRGLEARAPYFHNGSAATLANVVDFYNARFTMNLSSQERQDLINFLQSL